MGGPAVVPGKYAKFWPNVSRTSNCDWYLRLVGAWAMRSGRELDMAGATSGFLGVENKALGADVVQQAFELVHE